jgi:hypothetical protein
MIFTTTGLIHRSLRPFHCHGRRVSSAILLAGFAALFAFESSIAAPMNYGTFTGDTVEYVDVTEDSTSGDALPLFGAPSVSGDSLDFNPVGFSASSAGGGSDITDSNLSFEVHALSGFAINNINLSEAGDTTLAGIGTDSTFSSVTADVFLNIVEVDGVGITPLNLPASLTFTPSGGNWGMATDGGGGPFFHTQWSGSLFLDVNQILTNNNVPFVFGATKLSLNIDNTLTAISEAGTSSVIAKKDFGGVSITINIPEPASWSIILLGATVLGVVGGRNRTAR